MRKQPHLFRRYVYVEEVINSCVHSTACKYTKLKPDKKKTYKEV